MRYSIRLLPRERIALLNMRLDPLLTTRTFADVAGVSELLEGLIFFTDQELRYDKEIKQEIRKYFAYKKNMPLTQMWSKESAPGEILSIDEIEQIGNQEISGKEIIEDLLPPYNPVDMDSHTTGWLNPLVDKKAEEILLNLFQVQDINEVKISDGELLRGLIHFLVNDRVFQYGFRNAMFIGSLYGLTYSETGAFLDDVISAIDEDKFLTFRANFLADYDKWIDLIEERSKDVIVSKSGEFVINRAIKRFIILDTMIRIYDYTASYLTFFEIALKLVEIRDNKKFVSVIKSVLKKELELFKARIDMTMQS